MAFADYKKGIQMNKTYIFAFMLFHSAAATQIYIENWSTFPVLISNLTIPEPTGTKTIQAHLNVQPGQSLPLRTNDAGPTFSNFNEITVEFNVDGYTKKETIFFPDEETQEASLAFTDSGYKRSPFNILKRK